MSQAIWSICLGLQPFAAAVIGPGCAIEASNAQAVDLWSRRSDLFGVADGRLALADATAQQKLTDSLQAAHVPPRQVIRCADPASGRLHWLVVSALPADPVGPASATPLSADRRFIVSFRLSDEMSVLFDPDRLMVDLGLTRSEARVAAARAEGLSVGDYAESTGASVRTVRWHLENARDKLGCASQSDLVRTVLLVSA